MARDIQGNHKDDRADMPKEPEYDDDGGTNRLAHAISSIIKPKGPHENPHQQTIDELLKVDIIRHMAPEDIKACLPTMLAQEAHTGTVCQ